MSSIPPDLNYRILVLGTETSDKTNFYESFTGKNFENDKCITTVTVENNSYNIEITDTAGTEEFPAMRELLIKKADGVIYVFSSINQQSFNEISRYRKQITDINPNLPNVIVGTNCDLEDQRVISTEQGERLAKEFEGHYFDVSTRLQINVKEVFVDLVRQMDGQHNKKPGAQNGKKKSKLSILSRRLSRKKEKA